MTESGLGSTKGDTTAMKLLIGIVLWWVLFIFCWPVAVAALVLYTLVWLSLLPFKLVGRTIDAGFELLKALLLLPARLVRR